MIMIPIGKSYISQNNKGKSAKNSLLLFVNTEGKIRNGNIVQYLDGTNSEIPATFFSDLYNFKVIKITGTLTYLTISDNLQFEIKYSNGKIDETSAIQRKLKRDNGNTSSISQCYDVWWVTWNENGTSTWEYMYSYCNEGGGGEQQCFGSFTSGGTIYNVGCGGGGGIEEIDYTKPVNWVVTNHPSGFWNIRSYEVLTGKKIGIDPAYFTGATHTSSSIFSNLTNPYVSVWHQLSAVAYLTNQYVARADVSGKVTNTDPLDPNQPPFDIPVSNYQEWASFLIF